MNKKLTLVYIHGATATSLSFSYIRTFFDNTEVLLDYDCSQGFYRNLEKMKEALTSYDNLFFISHSLGGIYALHLADHYKDKTVGGVSLSTPYGGSKEADYLRLLFPCNRLLRDVGPNAKPIRDLDSVSLPNLWINVVTNKDNGLWRTEPNDGIVTKSSMTYRKDMRIIEVPVNHYEVVVSKQVVEIIKQVIKEGAPN